MEGDTRRPAQQTSCDQAIAADGVFAVAMLAEYREPLEAYGPWFYRRLYWETGVVGQVLYLEAEATGIRGTGIGCFFDDPRLRTHPPYQHLVRGAGASQTSTEP